MNAERYAITISTGSALLSASTDETREYLASSEKLCRDEIACPRESWDGLVCCLEMLGPFLQERTERPTQSVQAIEYEQLDSVADSGQVSGNLRAVRIPQTLGTE